MAETLTRRRPRPCPNSREIPRSYRDAEPIYRSTKNARRGACISRCLIPELASAARGAEFARYSGTKIFRLRIKQPPAFSAFKLLGSSAAKPPQYIYIGIYVYIDEESLIRA